MICCPYKDSARDIRSNILLHLQEFPRASPLGTPSGEGVYLTVYPSSRPNTDTVKYVVEVEQKYFFKAKICVKELGGL